MAHCHTDPEAVRVNTVELGITRPDSGHLRTSKYGDIDTRNRTTILNYSFPRNFCMLTSAPADARLQIQIWRTRLHHLIHTQSS